MAVRKPRALSYGARIGIVAPAGCVDEAALEKGVAALRREGFAVELAASILARKGYLAGDPQARARELLGRLSVQVDRVPVAELLKALLDETCYPAVLSTEGSRLQRNSEKLLADAHASGSIRVNEFLEYVETLNASGAREGESPAEAEGAVRLMTVHRAKGLQFPVVVVADASRASPNTKRSSSTSSARSSGSEAKCAKARLASAILWVSSRFLTAVPRLLAASISSPERRSTIVVSLRLRAAAISQRIARA